MGKNRKFCAQASEFLLDAVLSSASVRKINNYIRKVYLQYAHVTYLSQMMGAHGFCMSAAGPPSRQAHTLQSLTKIHIREVISVPLSHYIHAPPPIATPQQFRPSSPLPSPAAQPLCPPIQPAARAPSMQAGARSSPRSGAAPPREGRASRGPPWAARTAGRAPCSRGRPGAGGGRRRVLSVCWGGRSCPCHRRAAAGQSAGHLPVGEDALPAGAVRLSRSWLERRHPRCGPARSSSCACRAGGEAEHRPVRPVPPRGLAFPVGRLPCPTVSRDDFQSLLKSPGEAAAISCKSAAERRLMYVSPHPASELSEWAPPAPSCPRIPRGVPVIDSTFRSPPARPAEETGGQGGPSQHKMLAKLMLETALRPQLEQRRLRTSSGAAPIPQGAGAGSGHPGAPALAVTAEERRGS